jgi:L-aspartate oxidase
MVFAPRVVEAVLAGRDGPRPTGAMRCLLGEGGRRIPAPDGGIGFGRELTAAKARDELQRAMTAHAGVLRDAASLERADRAARQALTHGSASDDIEAWELRNLATVGRALIAAATVREESRGAHTRTDFPETSPAFALRLVVL